VQDYVEIGQQWHFYECRYDRALADGWEVFTQDDGGHLFRFHWRPIGAKIENPLGPVFDLARTFIQQKIELR